MSTVLHKAIRDAIRAGGYEQKAVHVSPVLDATAEVAARDDDLYDAVYRLFCAMPARLVHGSLFLVSTQDVEDGIELSWDAREEPRAGYAPGQGLLAAYEETEPIAVALRDLERSCQMRAGHVRATFERVSNSSSFQRAPYLHRRVVAHLPIKPALAEAREKERASQVPHVTVVPAQPRTVAKKEDAWSLSTQRRPLAPPVPTMRNR